MNIKQRAHELLTCDELRGRVPEEVQQFLRDVVALEPVAVMTPMSMRDLESGRKKHVRAWRFMYRGPQDFDLYTLGAPNDPA